MHRAIPMTIKVETITKRRKLRSLGFDSSSVVMNLHYVVLFGNERKVLVENQLSQQKIRTWIHLDATSAFFLARQRSQ